jgi:hypothetical protein
LGSNKTRIVKLEQARGARARRYVFYFDEVAEGRSARLALRARTQGFEQPGMDGAVCKAMMRRSLGVACLSAQQRDGVEDMIDKVGIRMRSRLVGDGDENVGIEQGEHASTAGAFERVTGARSGSARAEVQARHRSRVGIGRGRGIIKNLGFASWLMRLPLIKSLPA